MSTMVDTESRLADALRVLLPYAVTDEPEWLPERDRLARQMAYNLAYLALAEYDQDQPVARPEMVVVASQVEAPLAA